MAVERASTARAVAPAASDADRASAAGVSSGRYLSELESLRGLAILLVFWFHVEGILFIPRARPDVVDYPFQSLIRAGHTGVSLFFVLSAFLLSLPFLQEPRGGPYLSLTHYARRRALRILPLYWTAVIVGALLTAAGASVVVPGKPVPDLWDAVPHLLFLSGFAGWAEQMRPYGDVWWSLVTEVEFYLLLPLLPLCLRWRWGRYLGVALLLGYAVLYGLLQAHVIRAQTLGGQHYLANSILARGPQFLIGGLAAWVYLRLQRWQRERTRPAPLWWRRGGADLALLATLFALAVLLEWVMAGGLLHFITVPYQSWHTLEGLLWAIVVLLVLTAPLLTRRLWDNPFLERMGLYSYSIYMWHMPLAWFGILGMRRWVRAPAGWNTIGFLEALAVLAVCLALSALTYHFIERPFLRRKARLR